MLNWDKVERLVLWFVVSVVISLFLQLTVIQCFWWSVLILWSIPSIIYIIAAHLQISPEGRAVLVTGCDTGFGHATALHLDKLGFVVFAGCLNSKGPGACKLRRDGSKNVHILQLDVTSQDQLKRAFTEVKLHLPAKGLWGIVNNAGWSTYGEVEWVPMNTFKKITEINVFGVVAALQTFLPLIRQSKGRVVNMASGLARFAVPMRSPYILSKYAIEGLSDCLRYEMKPWGVHVSIIEPGNYIAGTNILTMDSIKVQADAMWDAMSDKVKADYGEAHFKKRVEQMRGYATSGVVDLSPVVNAFTEGLMQVYPQDRYHPMNFYFKIRLFIATHFPEFVYDYFYIDYLAR